MPIPDLVQRTAQRILAEYCQSRTRSGCDAWAELLYEGDGQGLTLLGRTGCRHPSGPGQLRPVARFCYSAELGQWTLHYPTTEHAWRFFLNAPPSLDLNKLLHWVDADPLGVFW